MATLGEDEINYNEDLVEKTKKAYEATSDLYVEKHGYTDEVKKQANLFTKMIKSKVFSPELEGNRVLDVGCGPGRDAEFFANRDFQVYGIDLVEDFIKLAQKRIPKGEFRVADMREIPYESNYFDGIWNCAALMHLPDARKSLKEHYRVLKPHGIIYLSVLNKKEDTVLTGDKYGEGEKFFKGYLPRDFFKLVQSSGFKMVSGSTNTDNVQNLNFIDVFATK